MAANYRKLSDKEPNDWYEIACANISHYLHIPNPEYLDDDVFWRKKRQAEYLLLKNHERL
ncbi:MAG: hypothetical protein IPL33_17880 [Sphingobacteriales bacterium]|nr:hypothetical protein [Sphingobacteriales bacterium]MCC7223885.1 hypothetical protein [Chitinophagales bacterium]